PSDLGACFIFLSRHFTLVGSLSSNLVAFNIRAPYHGGRRAHVSLCRTLLRVSTFFLHPARCGKTKRGSANAAPDISLLASLPVEAARVREPQQPHIELRLAGFLLFLAETDDLAGIGDGLHGQAETLKLLHQHAEARRDARLLDRLALHDRLVGADTPLHVVALDREHLLQRVRRAVCLERPDFHLAETLAAELGLTAERLLRHQRVRTGRAGMHLVLDEV